MPADDPSPSPEIRLLLELIDQAYDRKAWHGTNLRGSLRGLGADDVLWRPGENRHNIAEQVLHAAYWKYVARRRLTGAKRGSFPLKGSNWFPVADDLTPQEWSVHIALLDAEHSSFRETVSTLTPDRLSQPLGDGAYTARAMVLGVASHDLYHAGQIQLLKRLQGSE